MKKTLKFLLLFSVMLCLSVLFLSSCKKDEPFNGINEELGLILEGGDFDGKSTLVCSKITESLNVNEVKNKLSGQAYNDTADLFIYYIKVVKNNLTVQPKGKVTITLPEPSASYSDYVVFNVTDTEVEKLDFTLSNGKITFEATSLSYFIIADSHVHSYTEWADATDGINHTRSCPCGYVALVPHDYNEWVPTTSGRKYTCETCGYVHNHVHEYISFTNASNGRSHTKTCSCGHTDSEVHKFDQGVPHQSGTLYTCTLCGHKNISLELTVKITVPSNSSAISSLKINGASYTEPVKFKYGTEITVEIKLKSGYEFIGWEYDDEILTKSRTYKFVIGESEFTRGKEEIEIKVCISDNDNVIDDLPIV